MRSIMAMALLGTMVCTNLSARETNETGKETVTFVHTDGFTKVSSKELTPPIIEELLKEYPTSKLAAVYKNKKGEFKLIMVLQSGTRRTVYIDQHGNWLNIKHIK